MAISKVNPVSGGKTAFRLTLTSGTSYTVPAGVTYLNVLLVGGGGGAAMQINSTTSTGTGEGASGQTIRSVVTTTGGSSIAYSIGAGGAGGSNDSGGTGGTTTFTGATSAVGGNGGTWYGNGNANVATFANNYGRPPAINSNSGSKDGGAGGPGWIEIEYWV